MKFIVFLSLSCLFSCSAEKASFRTQTPSVTQPSGQVCILMAPALSIDPAMEPLRLAGFGNFLGAFRFAVTAITTIKSAEFCAGFHQAFAGR